MVVLDSISCMIGGLFTPAGKIVTEALSQEESGILCGLIIRNRKNLLVLTQKLLNNSSIKD